MSTRSQPERQRLIEHILKLSEDIFRMVSPMIPAEWLSSDLTVAQLRVLLLLYTEGSSRMSLVASRLDVALSTATGIVDNLVNKELVERTTLSDDRRVVLCRLTGTGEQLVGHVWELGRTQIDQLLRGLTSRQLQQAAAVAESLLASARKPAAAPVSLPTQEAS